MIFSNLSENTAQSLQLKTVKTSPVKKQIISKRIYSENNYQLFYLQSYDWSKISSITCVNQASEIFKNIICYYHELAFPVQNCYVKNNINTNWISQTATELKNRLSFVGELRHKNKNSQNVKEIFKQLNRKLTSVLIKDRKKLNARKIKSGKNKNKEVWNVIKNIFNNNNGKKEKMTISDRDMQITDKEIPDFFNKYFTEVPKNIMKDLRNTINSSFHENLIEHNSNSFFLKPVHALDVLEVIKKITLI